jgi:hypothetical protein
VRSLSPDQRQALLLLRDLFVTACLMAGVLLLLFEFTPKP